ncbi:twin-arginine translocation signal domain-containing protein [Streptomyces ziwulingensis]
MSRMVSGWGLSIIRMGGGGAICPAAGARRREYALMHASSDTSGVVRRRFLKGALAAAAGGVLVPAVAGPSWAVPPVGQRVRLSVSVPGAVMATGLQPGRHTLSFTGSRMTEVLVGGADWVRLKTLDFRIQAHHSLFGTITITTPDISTAPLSILRWVSPNELTETWYESLRITFERSADQAGPFVLLTQEPFKATATMPSWPPPPHITNADGSSTGGALYSAAQLPTFTAEDLRTDFTAFPATLGQLTS